MKKSFNKTYVKRKIVQLLKSTNVIFIGTDSLIDAKSQLMMNQNLNSSKYKIYKIKSNLFKQVLENSIFTNYSFISVGPIAIVESITCCNNLMFLNKLTTNFFAVKVNNNIYTSQQFSKLDNFNYINNVKGLNKSLDKLTKNISITFSCIKKI